MAEKSQVVVLGGGFGGVRVALNRTLDIVFSKDTVQIASDAGMRVPAELKTRIKLAGGA